MPPKKRVASQPTTGGKKAKKDVELSLAPSKSRGDEAFSQSQNPASSAVSEIVAQTSQSSQQTTGGKKANKATELSFAPTKIRADDDAFSQSQNPASSAVSENDAQTSHSDEPNDEHAAYYTEPTLKEFIQQQTKVCKHIGDKYFGLNTNYFWFHLKVFFFIYRLYCRLQRSLAHVVLMSKINLPNSLVGRMVDLARK